MSGSQWTRWTLVDTWRARLTEALRAIGMVEAYCIGKEGHDGHGGTSQSDGIHDDRRYFCRRPGAVNKAVPSERLREEALALAQRLACRNPAMLRATKHGLKRCREFTGEQS